MRKTVLITGASRGIGFAIAKSLQSDFENIILVAKHAETLDKAAKAFETSRIFKYIVDLESEKEILKFTMKINKKFKSIDVLVNNAGVYIGKRFAKQSLFEINRMLNLNLRSCVHLTHQLLPSLVKGENPQIINISSVASHINIYGEGVYSATKAAMSSLSDVLRKELNKEGIRITAVQPYGVDTYSSSHADSLLNPINVGEAVKYIISTPPSVQIDVLELSNINQWRGQKPAWIE